MPTTASRQAPYGFTVTRQGYAQVFTYRKAGYGIRTLLLAMPVFAIPALIPAMIWGAAAWALFTFLLPVIGYFAMNAVRRKGSLSITPYSVEVNGIAYRREHIHDLFIRAPFEKERVVHIEQRRRDIAFVTGGDRHAQAGMNADVAVAQSTGTAVHASGIASGSIAMKMKRLFLRRNYRVGFIYEGKKILLAGCLAENTGPALLRRIGQALELA